MVEVPPTAILSIGITTAGLGVLGYWLWQDRHSLLNPTDGTLILLTTFNDSLTSTHRLQVASRSHPYKSQLSKS
eukprot:g61749.t1